MPLISLILSSNEKSIYIGGTNNLEEKACIENDILFLGIDIKKKGIINFLKEYNDLCRRLKKYKIDKAITTGGYVSSKLCLYAILHRIPLYLIEENCIMGNANILFYPFCKKLFTAFDTFKKNKSICTGIPIRRIVKGNNIKEYDVLVIGGSLGSIILCEIAVSLSKKYKVCLIAGRYYEKYKKYKELEVINYTNDIYTYMNKAKSIISRAGASTSYEIMTIGIPWICIPSLNTKKNHQVINAQYFKSNNACYICYEDDMSLINEYVKKIIFNDSIRVNMISSQKKLIKNNSTEIILSYLEEKNEL